MRYTEKAMKELAPHVNENSSELPRFIFDSIKLRLSSGLPLEIFELIETREKKAKEGYRAEKAIHSVKPGYEEDRVLQDIVCFKSFHYHRLSALRKLAQLQFAEARGTQCTTSMEVSKGSDPHQLTLVHSAEDYYEQFESTLKILKVAAHELDSL